MLPLVAGLATAVPGIVGGVVGKIAHNKYAKLLEGLSLDMPSQYDEARGIYQKLAATGLPGVDQAKLDLMGNVPSTLKAYQSVAENPASIMGALTDVQSGVNQGLTDLSIKDAVAKISNMQNLGAYMQQEGAVQGQYDQYNNQLKMSAEAERMAGTSEMLKSFMGGIGGGISAATNMQMANDFSAYYNPADPSKDASKTTPSVASTTAPSATPYTADPRISDLIGADVDRAIREGRKADPFGYYRAGKSVLGEDMRYSMDKWDKGTYVDKWIKSTYVDKWIKSLKL